MILKIKQLFGKKDITVDFSNRTNIIIGENGSGKSTILKIIYYISKRDFISLSKILFESITIEIDGVSETIYYQDLQPIYNYNKLGFELLLKKYCEKHSYIKDLYKLDNYDFDIKKSFEFFYCNFLEETKKLDKFNNKNYDYKCEFDKYHNEDLMLYFGVEYNARTSELFNMNYNTLKGYFSNIFIKNRAVYGSKLYLFNLFYYFVTLRCAETTIGEYDFESIWLYFPANGKEKYISKEAFEDKNKMYFFTDEAYYNNKIIEDIYYLKLDEMDFLKKVLYDDYVTFKSSFTSKFIDYNCYSSLTINKIYRQLASKLMDLYYQTNLEIGKNVNDEHFYLKIDDIRKNEKMKKVLSLLYYGRFQIIEDPEEKIKYQRIYEEYVDLLPVRKRLGKKKIKDDDPGDVKYKKLLKSKNVDPIKCLIDIYDVIYNEKNKELLDEELKLRSGYYFYGDSNFPYNITALFDYINENYTEILNLRDSRAYKIFEKLTKKYIRGKNLDYCFDSLGQMKIEVVDEVTGLSVDESKLSSGEQKILRIIKLLAVNIDNFMLLLDEPELSLSIYWQEMLIKDIEENSNCSKIIIATQSPNLINEDQINYIIEIKKEV